MPNWAYNNLEIHGDFEDITKFLDGLTYVRKSQWDDNWYPSILDSYYPCPEELAKVTSPIRINDDIAKQEEMRKALEYEWYKKEDGTPYSIDDLEFQEKFEERWKIYIEGAITREEYNRLIKEYGYSNWYKWCINMWGTKWGDCETRFLTDSIEVNENGVDYSRLKRLSNPNVIILRFDSAWSPPTAGLDEISKKFPSLKFILRTTEESNMYAYKALWELSELQKELTIDPNKLIDKVAEDMGYDEDNDEDYEMWDKIMENVDMVERLDLLWDHPEKALEGEIEKRDK